MGRIQRRRTARVRSGVSKRFVDSVFISLLNHCLSSSSPPSTFIKVIRGNFCVDQLSQIRKVSSISMDTSDCLRCQKVILKNITRRVT